MRCEKKTRKKQKNKRIFTLATANATASSVGPETKACKGSSSPGIGCPSFRASLPSLTEPLPLMIIFAVD